MLTVVAGMCKMCFLPRLSTCPKPQSSSSSSETASASQLVLRRNTWHEQMHTNTWVSQLVLCKARDWSTFFNFPYFCQGVSEKMKTTKKEHTKGPEKSLGAQVVPRDSEAVGQAALQNQNVHQTPQAWQVGHPWLGQKNRESLSHRSSPEDVRGALDHGSGNQENVKACIA